MPDDENAPNPDGEVAPDDGVGVVPNPDDLDIPAGVEPFDSASLPPLGEHHVVGLELFPGFTARGTRKEGLRGISERSSGVFGSSDSGFGLRGESVRSHGVVARSREAAGLWADTAGNAPGVIGTSSQAQGVWGESKAANRSGVAGVGHAGHGVVGETRSIHHAGVTARGPVWAGRFEGKVHILTDLRVNGDILLTGADLAEEFTVADDDAEPGTVMVLAGADVVRVSTDAYDTRVAGVLSGAGGYRPALILDRAGPGRSALAMTGKVWVRVSTENGPVGIGDLLTTATTRGHAMRASDPSRSHGAVIGKALDTLHADSGLIRALVTLH